MLRRRLPRSIVCLGRPFGASSDAGLEWLLRADSLPPPPPPPTSAHSQAGQHHSPRPHATAPCAADGLAPPPPPPPPQHPPMGSAHGGPVSLSAAPPQAAGDMFTHWGAVDAPPPPPPPSCPSHSLGHPTDLHPQHDFGAIPTPPPPPGFLGHNNEVYQHPHHISGTTTTTTGAGSGGGGGLASLLSGNASKPKGQYANGSSFGEKKQYSNKFHSNIGNANYKGSYDSQQRSPYRKDAYSGSGSGGGGYRPREGPEAAAGGGGYEKKPWRSSKDFSQGRGRSYRQGGGQPWRNYNNNDETSSSSAYSTNNRSPFFDQQPFAAHQKSYNNSSQYNKNSSTFEQRSSAGDSYDSGSCRPTLMPQGGSDNPQSGQWSGQTSSGGYKKPYFGGSTNTEGSSSRRRDGYISRSSYGGEGATSRYDCGPPQDPTLSQETYGQPPPYSGSDSLSNPSPTTRAILQQDPTDVTAERNATILSLTKMVKECLSYEEAIRKNEVAAASHRRKKHEETSLEMSGGGSAAAQAEWVGPALVPLQPSGAAFFGVDRSYLVHISAQRAAFTSPFWLKKSELLTFCVAAREDATWYPLPSTMRIVETTTPNKTRAATSDTPSSEVTTATGESAATNAGYELVSDSLATEYVINAADTTGLHKFSSGCCVEAGVMVRFDGSIFDVDNKSNKKTTGRVGQNGVVLNPFYPGRFGALRLLLRFKMERLQSAGQIAQQQAQIGPFPLYQPSWQSNATPDPAMECLIERQLHAALVNGVPERVTVSSAVVTGKILSPYLLPRWFSSRAGQALAPVAVGSILLPNEGEKKFFEFMNFKHVSQIQLLSRLHYSPDSFSLVHGDETTCSNAFSPAVCFRYFPTILGVSPIWMKGDPTSPHNGEAVILYRVVRTQLIREVQARVAFASATPQTFPYFVQDAAVTLLQLTFNDDVSFEAGKQSPLTHPRVIPSAASWKHGVVPNAVGHQFNPALDIDDMSVLSPAQLPPTKRANAKEKRSLSVSSNKRGNQRMSGPAAAAENDSEVAELITHTSGCYFNTVFFKNQSFIQLLSTYTAISAEYRRSILLPGTFLCSQQSPITFEMDADASSDDEPKSSDHQRPSHSTRYYQLEDVVYAAFVVFTRKYSVTSPWVSNLTMNRLQLKLKNTEAPFLTVSRAKSGDDISLPPQEDSASSGEAAAAPAMYFYCIEELEGFDCGMADWIFDNCQRKNSFPQKNRTH